MKEKLDLAKMQARWILRFLNAIVFGAHWSLSFCAAARKHEYRTGNGLCSFLDGQKATPVGIVLLFEISGGRRIVISRLPPLPPTCARLDDSMIR